jgi:hypothetical protein
MEFFNSLNRLNVAASRAKGVSILVGSPRIFAAECRHAAEASVGERLVPLWRDSEMHVVCSKISGFRGVPS